MRWVFDVIKPVQEFRRITGAWPAACCVPVIRNCRLGKDAGQITVRFKVWSREWNSAGLLRQWFRFKDR